MKSKETLKFINENIKGSKIKIFLLSLSQALLGALTVAFSFMLKDVFSAIREGKQDDLIKYTIIVASLALGIIILQILSISSLAGIGLPLNKNFVLLNWFKRTHLFVLGSYCTVNIKSKPVLS